MDWPRLMLNLPGISAGLREKAARAVSEIQPYWEAFTQNSFDRTQSIIHAFHQVRLDDRHFQPSTGYGYGDSGRDALESVYSLVFGAEDALVRQQIVSGTHAISLCLTTFLKPGDLLVSAAGAPYDTLCRVIGTCRPEPGSLCASGVRYLETPLSDDRRVDFEAFRRSLVERPRMVLIQRSRGYTLAPSRTMEEIAGLVRETRSLSPDSIILVDNCYGEFVESLEPPMVGADLTAGSLIKNPGGGLAPGGGYVVGTRQSVRLVAERLYAPVIGGEIGPSLSGNRLFFQGFFLAPHFVSQALMGAVFVARLAELCGFSAQPGPDEMRTDIIQSLGLRSPDGLIRFCRGLQKASPVGAHIIPEPSPMPGYEDPVIMAGGTFVQGASLELSADAPLRPPYAVYLQGGFSVEQITAAVVKAMDVCLSGESG